MYGSMTPEQHRLPCVALDKTTGKPVKRWETVDDATREHHFVVTGAIGGYDGRYVINGVAYACREIKILKNIAYVILES